jgi:sugar-specific transcriptional regulator TrmB
LPDGDDSDAKEKAADSIVELPNLEEFQDRLDEISSRLARLERLIERMGPGIDEVSQSARVIREGFDFYNSMLQVMSKFTRAERLESRFKDLKKDEIRDEISWKIIQILDGSRPLNISQITASVRAERGTASRRIIRDRVKGLVGRNIIKIIEDEDDRARYYALAEDYSK